MSPTSPWLTTTSTWNTRSHIYRRLARSDDFDLAQEVDTNGAVEWKAFTLAGVACLAVANSFHGSTYNVKSRIYRYSAILDFELLQVINTSAAYDLESFTLDGEGATYLVVANHYDGKDYNLTSTASRQHCINLSEVVQAVNTSGALDWEAFTMDGGAP